MFNVRVPESMLRALSSAALLHKTSASEYVRRVLEQDLKERGFLVS